MTGRDGAFRLLVWNVEWFNTLFDDDGALELHLERSGRYGVSREAQAEAVAHVLREVDADAVLVVEAPDQSSHRSTRAALEGFAGWAGLRTTQTVIGFGNDTRQEIALMLDPDRVKARHVPGASEDAPRFDGRMRVAVCAGGKKHQVVWSKPPLELDLETPAGALHLIGVHAKSKAPHGAETPEEEREIALRNRLKQVGQAIWLRARVDALLAEGRDVVVAGDLNDGPGLDRWADLLERTALGVLAGDGVLHDPAAAAVAEGGATPWTARFWDERDERLVDALLDYALVSERLRPRAAWRVLHPDNADLDDGMRAALGRASDHFPIRLDLSGG